MVAVSTSLRQCWLSFEILDKIMLIMKIWLEDPRSSCITSEGLKTIEEYLNVEDNLLEENEELITNFDLFEMWTSRLTLEHQVHVDNYEGETKRNYFLPFDVVHCLSLNFLNGLIGLLKACVL
jgi:hypothetical protein